MVLLNRLWRTLTMRQRQRVILLIGAVIVMALLEVVNVSAIAPFLTLASNPTMIHDNPILVLVYEHFEFSSVNSFLIAVGMGVFGLMLLSNGWAALATWAQLRLVWSWNHQLSVRLLERYLSRPYSYFLIRNTADLSKNLLSEIQQITNQMIKPVILAIGRAVVALGIICVLILTNPVLAVLVTLVVGGSYGIIYATVRRKLRQIGQDRVWANSKRFTIANEALAGIKDAKVLNVEEEFLARFRSPSYRFSRHQATSQTIAALPRHAIETVAFGTVILIVVYLLAIEQSFNNIVPTLGLYAFAGYRLMPALQEVFRAVTEARFYGAALESILDDLESDSPGSLVIHPDTTPPIVPKKAILLRDISYYYPGTDYPAIDGVTLEIPANQTIGLVGETGSGKTTMADIILGLLHPQSGEILVDGVSVTDETLRSWQASIGYVPQHIFLTDATVAENIAFGLPRERVDMQKVRAAAKIAQIDDFVMQELPQGYDTVVGERGVRLSGGQRQRIGIARALYRDPAVIVFDEATSALDNTTEDNVMSALATLLGKKTVIMIAHRLTTLAQCDAIYMLRNGSVAARGSYEDLVEGRGAFADISTPTSSSPTASVTG